MSEKDALRDGAVEVVRNTILRIETLETRNRDSLDFHDLSVWTLKAALEAAFDAGRTIGRHEGLSACGMKSRAPKTKA